jgi:hypothetical protein
VTGVTSIIGKSTCAYFSNFEKCAKKMQSELRYNLFMASLYVDSAPLAEWYMEQ